MIFTLTEVTEFIGLVVDKEVVTDLDIGMQVRGK